MIDVDVKEINSLEDLMKAANEEFETPSKESKPESKPEPEVNDESVTGESEPGDDKDVIDDKDSYVPDLTFKVKDQVFNFDERLKPIIKSKKDEEYVRQILTKANGLDSYKEKVQKYDEQLTSKEQEILEYRQRVDESQKFYKSLVDGRNSKDWRSVAKKIGYSDDDILSMALEVAQERELPIEQQRIANEARMNSYKAKELDQTTMDRIAELERREAALNESTLVNQSNVRVQQETAALNNVIATKHKDLSDKLNEFGLNMFDEVVATGRSMARIDNQGRMIEPSIDDALAAVVTKYQKVVTANKPSAQQQQRVKKDTISSVKGSNANVVDSPIKTLEDIQKELNSYNSKKY